MAKFKEHIRRWFTAAAPRMTAVCAAVITICAVCSTLVTTVNTIQVEDSDGAVRTVMAAVTQHEELLELAGMKMESNDSTRLSEAEDGTLVLSLQRAFPVDVRADGKDYQIDISEGTIKDAVERAGLTLGENDYTVPKLSAPVSEDMEIQVHRVTYEDHVEMETVPFETEYRDETEGTKGRYTREELLSEGKDGKTNVTYRQKFIDGVYDSTQVISREVVEEPVAQVYRRYKTNAISPLPAPPGITVVNNVPSSYSTVYTMKATGYSASRGRGASGLGLYCGTFACDPTLIPYGTKVYITSEDGRFVYGWAIATDTGAFIHTNRMQVDLFYETYAESAANGVKTVKVYIP